MSNSTTWAAVIDSRGQQEVSPPRTAIPVSTVTSIPPRKTKPSIVSNESSSLTPDATSGRYQPIGGGGLRTRVRPSRMPRRWRMRPMVRLEGIRAVCCSSIAARMASAPKSPRSLTVNSLRNLRTSSSVTALVRLMGRGAPEGRSLQFTRSSRVVDARSTHRRTVCKPTPKVRAVRRNDCPRRTACTIARRCCSTKFCAHGSSHFYLHHINLPPVRGTGLWKLPGCGKPAMKPAAFPQPLENAPPSTRPRFPQLPQPLPATRNRAVRFNQTSRNLGSY